MNINQCSCRPYEWLGLDGNRCIRVIPRQLIPFLSNCMAKTKLAILTFLYLREFVKIPILWEKFLKLWTHRASSGSGSIKVPLECIVTLQNGFQIHSQASTQASKLQSCRSVCLYPKNGRVFHKLQLNELVKLAKTFNHWPKLWWELNPGPNIKRSGFNPWPSLWIFLKFYFVEFV